MTSKFKSGATRITVCPVGADRYRCTVSLSDRRYTDRPRKRTLTVVVSVPAVNRALGLGSTAEDAACGVLDLVASDTPVFGDAAAGSWGAWRLDAA